MGQAVRDLLVAAIRTGFLAQLPHAAPPCASPQPNCKGPADLGLDLPAPAPCSPTLQTPCRTTPWPSSCCPPPSVPPWTALWAGEMVVEVACGGFLGRAHRHPNTLHAPPNVLPDTCTRMPAHPCTTWLLNIMCLIVENACAPFPICCPTQRQAEPRSAGLPEEAVVSEEGSSERRCINSSCPGHPSAA